MTLLSKLLCKCWAAHSVESNRASNCSHQSFAMQNSDWRRILKVTQHLQKQMFHSTIHNSVVLILCYVSWELIFIPMQFAMQNSDWRRILLSDSTPPKANIRSTLLCTIYCLNYFAKMLSGPQSYMESNSASNWYSFQMQFAMQNSEWRRILLSDSTPPKADLFHSTMHNLLSKLLC